ncbi:hypothetical protein ACN2MM_08740 [Alkalilimnicola ehrlichii MLHE-1]|nr:hypothetical protein [Alkalilimnicola ehrlichii]
MPLFEVLGDGVIFILAPLVILLLVMLGYAIKTLFFGWRDDD